MNLLIIPSTLPLLAALFKFGVMQETKVECVAYLKIDHKGLEGLFWFASHSRQA